MRNAIRYLYKYSFQKDAYRGTSLGPLLIAKRIPEDEARCGEDRPGCAPIMNPPKQPEEPTGRVLCSNATLTCNKVMGGPPWAYQHCLQEGRQSFHSATSRYGAPDGSPLVV